MRVNDKGWVSQNYFLKTGHWTVNDLEGAIWDYKNGRVPVGGYPLQWYEDELYRRTGSKKGWHEE